MERQLSGKSRRAKQSKLSKSWLLERKRRPRCEIFFRYSHLLQDYFSIVRLVQTRRSTLARLGQCQKHRRGVRQWQIAWHSVESAVSHRYRRSFTAGTKHHRGKSNQPVGKSHDRGSAAECAKAVHLHIANILQGRFSTVAVRPDRTSANHSETHGGEHQLTPP